jgi:hypothetical protein
MKILFLRLQIWWHGCVNITPTWDNHDGWLSFIGKKVPRYFTICHQPWIMTPKSSTHYVQGGMLHHSVFYRSIGVRR